MATALWLRTIKHQRMDKQHVEPCTRDNPQSALEEACRKLDIGRPSGWTSMSVNGRNSARPASCLTTFWSPSISSGWRSNS